MKKVEEKYFKNPEQYIPEGAYCYNGNETCPFWEINESKPNQENGYCHFLKKGDWNLNNNYFGGLLWDRCKECNIKKYEKWCADCEYGELISNEEEGYCKVHKINLNMFENYCESNFKPKVEMVE